MTNTNKEEMELDDMSIDELEALAIKMESAETDDESDSVEEEAVETSDPVEEEAQEVEAEEPNPEQEEAEPETKDSELPKPYQNKSEKEWYEMQKNANTKISQQGNEIYQMRKQLEALQSKQNELNNKALKSDDEEILSKYQQEDIEAINRLFDRRLQEIEQEKFQATQQERESIAKEHDQIWDNLQTLNPQLFLSIKDEAMETMKQDPINTYQRKGWLKQFISSQAQKSMTAPAPVIENKSGVKRRAVTVGSGARASSKTSTKSIDDMSAAEYADYARKNLGFADF